MCSSTIFGLIIKYFATSKDEAYAIMLQYAVNLNINQGSGLFYIKTAPWGGFYNHWIILSIIPYFFASSEVIK